LSFSENATKGTTLNIFVLVPLLNACASLGALEEGRYTTHEWMGFVCQNGELLG
jgi:hypothetical protein